MSTDFPRLSRPLRIAREVALFLILASTLNGAFAGELVDPTRPPNERRQATAKVNKEVSRLTAIFWSGERRVAVFDGRVVKAGDRVGDVFIEEILIDGVRFRHDGRIEVARLPKLAASIRRQIDSEETEP